MLLGSLASTLLLAVCICYIAGIFKSTGAMGVSNSIDFFALLSQKVLILTVFSAIAGDILKGKTPNER